VFIASV